MLALDTSSLHSREEEFKDERPKSPWTPSYSVISQGTVDKNVALDQLDQLPPSVVSASPDAVLALESAPDSSNFGSNEAEEMSRSLRRIPSINITSSEESEDNPAVAQDTAAAAASDEVPLPKVSSQLEHYHITLTMAYCSLRRYLCKPRSLRYNLMKKGLDRPGAPLIR